MQWQKFEEILRPYLMEHDWQDLLARAQELRVPFAAVLDAKTLLENDHLASRRFFQEIDQPGIGKLPLAGGPFNMAGTPLRYGPAPALGEHTADVLGDAGYDPDDQRILRERGVA
jgi:CoA:oxalate CoA-transferase